MTVSDTSHQTGVVLQQLLFGYDHGHALLASSDGNAKKLSQKILSDTDWDPRISPQTDEYLSARPVQGAKHYVIMKTWRAPEMPRPGCVWTHALLISDADFSRIPDLSILHSHFQRPQAGDKFKSYKRPIEIGLATISHMSFSPSSQLVSNLVELTYADQFREMPISASHEIELCFLKLWSQQWPSLRRNFSFRTGPVTSTKSGVSTSFDVELKRPATPISIKIEDKAALQCIAQDILGNRQSDFRKFLWRYGADIGSDRQQLVHLTQLFQTLHHKEPLDLEVSTVVNKIAHWFPRRDDASLLKKELTNFQDSKYSLIPELDQFGIVQSVRSNNTHLSFPQLGPVDRKTVNKWIRDKPLETGKLLEEVSESSDQFALSLFDGIAPDTHKEFLWNLLPDFEHAFLRASHLSLIHLADPRIDTLSDKQVLSLLENDTNSNENVERLLPYLLSRDSTEIISSVVKLVPDAVIDAVIAQIANSRDQTGATVHTNWIECVKDQTDQVLRFTQTNVKSMSELLVCRYFLNADNTRYPLSTWSQKLEDITDDLPADVDIEFRVFLLVQVLRSSDGDAHTILKRTFEKVHEALLFDRLAFRTKMYLADYLPNIGWINNWDKCLRLRIAVVQTYKGHELPKKQLRQLTKDSKLGSQLEQIWAR